MAASAGRDLRIKYSSDGGTTYAVIAGARTDNLTINRESIDVTDKDDAGVRQLLGEVGSISIDMSVAGVMKDGTLLALAADATTSTLLDFQIDISGIGTITGGWFLSNFEVGGEDGANATTFTCNLQSGDDFTYA